MVFAEKDIQEIIKKQHFTFDDLVQILKYLRSENGCPWDREQTHKSIELNTIEEAYELVDAVNKASNEKIIEESGDVILQSVFHGVIGEEAGEFTVQDIIDGECRKLIDRHSHIFGSDKAENTEDALKNWDKNKYSEKKLESAGQRISDVPEVFPALLRAQKVQKRASKFNYDFANAMQAFEKLQEELAEVLQAKKSGDKEKIQEEIGDLLFSVVNVARFCEVDSETALKNATDKFINRFLQVEKLIVADGKDFLDLSLEELDNYYNEVKKH